MNANALTTLAHLKDFLARTRSMSAVPDFDVEKDPRTGPILPNPARTMAIQETADELSDALFEVRYEGSWH